MPRGEGLLRGGRGLRCVSGYRPIRRVRPLDGCRRLHVRRHTGQPHPHRQAFVAPLQEPGPRARPAERREERAFTGRDREPRHVVVRRDDLAADRERLAGHEVSRLPREWLASPAQARNPVHGTLGDGDQERIEVLHRPAVAAVGGELGPQFHSRAIRANPVMACRAQRAAFLLEVDERFDEAIAGGGFDGRRAESARAAAQRARPAVCNGQTVGVVEPRHVRAARPPQPLQPYVPGASHGQGQLDAPGADGPPPTRWVPIDERVVHAGKALGLPRQRHPPAHGQGSCHRAEPKGSGHQSFRQTRAGNVTWR